jgi:hypothetical protein
MSIVAIIERIAFSRRARDPALAAVSASNGWYGGRREPTHDELYIYNQISNMDMFRSL